MRLPRALVALSVTLILGLTLGGPTAVADPPAPPGTKASVIGQDHRSDQAEATLARVRTLVEGLGVSSRGGADDNRGLTLALRDLALQMDALSPSDERVAERYLLRPGQGSDPFIPVALPFVTCSADICVHWRESGDHAPNGSDGDGSTVPTYVNRVLNTIQRVNNDYVAAGYRRPKSDGTAGGGTGKVDIYIGDLGANGGLYGFCSTDRPRVLDAPDDYSKAAFCALDNDYRPGQFPTNTPLENMQVTAAHEYFHAVQFGYDFYEDGWILESTATWAEDELFDDVNDNRNYLPTSPLRRPHVPLDTFGGNFHYGTWIWWRYLTEKFPAEVGKLPRLVLDVWKRLDGRPGAPDRYSTQGLAQALNGRGTTIKKELQLFYGVNRHPRTYYDEGAAYNPSPSSLNVAFSGAQQQSVVRKPRHLSSSTVKLVPNGLSQSDWRLRLHFNAPDTARGGAFVVIVYKKAGGLSTSLVRLDRNGGGSRTVPFSSQNIDHVDVLFVNTSTRFNCWEDTVLSCQGKPKDDGLRSELTARTFRS
ncbi:MXAN_6640 family putative metalloprotease [Nocardioides bizhenqiangii]|uniref:MXAN_6640 family putative metalloprotease n=1 Tax=Nocardioides bizhenqiangii TaxID=3095076 RepID=A0ABZ0ZLS2_9ACTN|nr:MXAN_6640 family putative metalloprotease [Nocardioides sp. HM61]WQQ25254.1 MXAN_6640 family putative metalloprotease [Nocardioides sp. HM61]